MIEIERKFLVNSGAYRNLATKKERMVQGFLNTHPNRTVRVRLLEGEGFLTIKGKSNDSGTTRFEWERQIPGSEAEELLKLCEAGIVEKVRYSIPYENHMFEVDVFFGSNEGLVIAEVELESETEVFKRPDWLGKEVTGKVAYYNSQLSKKPFKTWKK